MQKDLENLTIEKTCVLITTWISELEHIVGEVYHKFFGYPLKFSAISLCGICLILDSKKQVNNESTAIFAHCLHAQ